MTRIPAAIFQDFDSERGKFRLWTSKLEVYRPGHFWVFIFTFLHLTFGKQGLRNTIANRFYVHPFIFLLFKIPYFLPFLKFSQFVIYLRTEYFREISMIFSFCSNIPSFILKFGEHTRFMEDKTLGFMLVFNVGWRGWLWVHMLEK